MMKMMKSSVDAMVFYPFEMILDKGSVVFFADQESLISQGIGAEPLPF